MQLSVIICCHNPRMDYLARVLGALKAQTLSTDNWELLVVDNASKDPVSASHDISWHPKAHHVREMNLGLTHARLRGIAESRRSEEHTSELQSQSNLVCRLLLEKKNSQQYVQHDKELPRRHGAAIQL